MKQKNNTNYEVLIVGIVAVVAIFAMIYPFMNFNYSGEDVAGKAYAMTDDGSVPEKTSKSTTSKSLGTLEQGMVDAGFHCVVGDYDRLGNLKECYVSEEICKENFGEPIYIDETHPCYEMVMKYGVTEEPEFSKSCADCSCSSNGASCSTPGISRKCDCKSFWGFRYACQGHCQNSVMRISSTN